MLRRCWRNLLLVRACCAMLLGKEYISDVAKTGYRPSEDVCCWIAANVDCLIVWWHTISRDTYFKVLHSTLPAWLFFTPMSLRNFFPKSCRVGVEWRTLKEVCPYSIDKVAHKASLQPLNHRTRRYYFCLWTVDAGGWCQKVCVCPKVLISV